MSVASPQVSSHPTLREAAAEFLAQKRIAVAGVSRDPKQPANLIYRRLRQTDHDVYAINPNAQEVEGDRCFASVADVPVPLDGAVVVTSMAAAEAVADDCIAAGVPRVWFHRGLGPGSRSEPAIERCRDSGMTVIPGGCPNMFGATSDAGHRFMCHLLQATGKVPRKV